MPFAIYNSMRILIYTKVIRIINNILDGDPVRLLRQSIEVHLDRAMTPSATRSVHRISPALSDQVVYCQGKWEKFEDLRLFNDFLHTQKSRVME